MSSSTPVPDPRESADERAHQPEGHAGAEFPPSLVSRLHAFAAAPRPIAPLVDARIRAAIAERTRAASRPSFMTTARRWALAASIALVAGALLGRLEWSIGARHIQDHVRIAISPISSPSPALAPTVIDAMLAARMTRNGAIPAIDLDERLALRLDADGNGLIDERDAVLLLARAVSVEEVIR